VVDGLTVLRHWRAGGRGMPVLILTARSAWHEKVMGMDAGADDYLAKPFHMEELLARLRACCAGFRPQQRPMAVRQHPAGHAPGHRGRRWAAADADQP
jgi:DNA-binding response OmpR family regulator